MPRVPESVLVDREGIDHEVDPRSNGGHYAVCERRGARWCIDAHMANANFETPPRSVTCLTCLAARDIDDPSR